MRIALTGATGFLGHYLVRQLARAGHRLRCWYRIGGDRGGLADAARAVEWTPGYLGDRASIEALLKDAEAVVHAAVDWDGPRNRRREREQQGDQRRARSLPEPRGSEVRRQPQNGVPISRAWGCERPARAPRPSRARSRRLRGARPLCPGRR